MSSLRRYRVLDYTDRHHHKHLVRDRGQHLAEINIFISD